MSAPPSRRLPAERTLRRAAALALVGLAVATYIAIADAGGGSPVCLAGGHGCETVASSSYSHLAGINVAVLGIGAYVLLLATALLAGDRARFGAFAVSTVGASVSASTSPTSSCSSSTRSASGASPAPC